MDFLGKGQGATFQEGAGTSALSPAADVRDQHSNRLPRLRGLRTILAVQKSGRLILWHTYS